MITFELVPEALRMSAIGMGGIFLAMGVIYLASIGLSKLFPEDKENK